MKLGKNLLQWKTTLIGLLFMGGAAAYVWFKEPELLILLSLIGLGISFLFAPDTVLKSLTTFIPRMLNKISKSDD